MIYSSFYHRIKDSRKVYVIWLQAFYNGSRYLRYFITLLFPVACESGFMERVQKDFEGNLCRKTVA